MNLTEPDKQRLLAECLTGWARNDPAPAGRLRVVVSETPDVIAWVRDGEVSHDGLTVLVRTSRRGPDLPEQPGNWLPYSGSLDEPGDEIQVQKTLWIQSADYGSLRYLSIAGPTVVRLYTAEDAEAFVADLRTARASGVLPEALLHAGVELGDRCALSGVACTASGLGRRLFVSADGVVRTAPGGLPIGTLADRPAVLAATARELATHGDLCVTDEVRAVLREVDPAELTGFLAALDAVRTLTLRTGGPWRVAGLGPRLVSSPEPDAAYGPRPDLLLLASPTEHVLFDARARRAFKINAVMAEVLDVLLHTDDPALIEPRIARCAGLGADPAGAVAGVRAEMSRRGIDLPVLAGSVR